MSASTTAVAFNNRAREGSASRTEAGFPHPARVLRKGGCPRASASAATSSLCGVRLLGDAAALVAVVAGWDAERCTRRMRVARWVGS